jgi:hypothetical protein
MKALLLIPTLLFALGAPLARADVSSLRCEIDLQGDGITDPETITLQKRDLNGFSEYTVSGVGRKFGLDFDAHITLDENAKDGTYIFTYSANNLGNPRVSISNTAFKAALGDLHTPPMDLFRGKRYFLVQLQCVPKDWPVSGSDGEQENEPEQTTSAQ